MRDDRCPAREWAIPPMDKEAGDKSTAFTWPMGNLILRRIAEGETVKAITADPRMPAYCTVFRWMQVVPEFGAAVAELRAELARLRREERAAVAAVRRRAHGRWWRAGRKSTYAPARAKAVLAAVAGGASLSEVVARPGAPSFKAWYRWLQVVPGLAEAYAEACRQRDLMLELARYEVIDAAEPGGLRAAGAALRRIDGRRGRIRPKLYRFDAEDTQPTTGTNR
ncbi:hypothetical protein [uncultured Phenylobacterium sp.]|uniref:terminase small subunit-like protein n=1 Tax=uncultured Phenylobacterium sp. TaxID=349273 RepID=UPI0025F19D85|nr:hypothetical protein [uncultured Phenylobacterium sp.]